MGLSSSCTEASSTHHDNYLAQGSTSGSDRSIGSGATSGIEYVRNYRGRPKELSQSLDSTYAEAGIHSSSFKLMRSTSKNNRRSKSRLVRSRSQPHTGNAITNTNSLSSSLVSKSHAQPHSSNRLASSLRRSTTENQAVVVETLGPTEHENEHVTDDRPRNRQQKEKHKRRSQKHRKSRNDELDREVEIRMRSFSPSVKLTSSLQGPRPRIATIEGKDTNGIDNIYSNTALAATTRTRSSASEMMVDQSDASFSNRHQPHYRSNNPTSSSSLLSNDKSKSNASSAHWKLFHLCQSKKSILKDVDFDPPGEVADVINISKQSSEQELHDIQEAHNQVGITKGLTSSANAETANKSNASSSTYAHTSQHTKPTTINNFYRSASAQSSKSSISDPTKKLSCQELRGDIASNPPKLLSTSKKPTFLRSAMQKLAKIGVASHNSSSNTSCSTNISCTGTTVSGQWSSSIFSQTLEKVNELQHAGSFREGENGCDDCETVSGDGAIEEEEDFFDYDKVYKTVTNSGEQDGVPKSRSTNKLKNGWGIGGREKGIGRRSRSRSKTMSASTPCNVKVDTTDDNHKSDEVNSSSSFVRRSRSLFSRRHVVDGEKNSRAESQTEHLQCYKQRAASVDTNNPSHSSTKTIDENVRKNRSSSVPQNVSSKYTPPKRDESSQSNGSKSESYAKCKSKYERLSSSKLKINCIICRQRLYPGDYIGFSNLHFCGGSLGSSSCFRCAMCQCQLDEFLLANDNDGNDILNGTQVVTNARGSIIQCGKCTNQAVTSVVDGRASNTGLSNNIVTGGKQ